jgi:addiction module HigA family antidote
VKQCRLSATNTGAASPSRTSTGRIITYDCSASPFFRRPPWLRSEIVELAGMANVTRLSGHLGVTRQALSALLNSRAGLSAEMAIRFEKAFGVKADTMLRMQAAHDLAIARSRERERVLVAQRGPEKA